VMQDVHMSKVNSKTGLCTINGPAHFRLGAIKKFHQYNRNEVMVRFDFVVSAPI